MIYIITFHLLMASSFWTSISCFYIFNLLDSEGIYRWRQCWSVFFIISIYFSGTQLYFSVVIEITHQHNLIFIYIYSTLLFIHILQTFLSANRAEMQMHLSYILVKILHVVPSNKASFLLLSFSEHWYFMLLCFMLPFYKINLLK